MSSRSDQADAAPGFRFADGSWQLDRERSELGFAAKSLWGLVTVRGSFRQYDAVVRVQAGEVAGELTIDADSIDTGNRKRDKHLRSADFLDAEQHPKIVFRRGRIISGAGGLMATGELLRGPTCTELAIPLSAGSITDGALRLEGRTTISRRLVGITWNQLGAVPDAVLVHVGLTLRRLA